MSKENNSEVVAKKPKLEDATLLNFENWMIKKNIHISPKVKISKEGSCARYGMVAISDIAKDEVLFTIPKQALLWPDSCSIKEFLQTSDELESTSGWCKLITCLMLEYTNEDSQWGPYLRFLPEASELQHPMFWTEQERTSLLKGSGCDAKVNDDLKKMESEFESIVKPFIKAHKKLGFDESKHNFHLYKYLVAIVMAYSFTDDNGDEGPKMVPLADVLNHVSKNNARLMFEPDHLSMIADQEINKGEEVFNTYGQLNNSQLLQNYGFIEEFPGNIFESVDFLFEDIIKVATDRHADKFINLKEKVSWFQQKDFFGLRELVFGNEGLLTPHEFYILSAFLNFSQETFDSITKADPEDFDELMDMCYLDEEMLEEDEDLIEYAKLTKGYCPKIKSVLYDVCNSYHEGYCSSSDQQHFDVSDAKKLLAEKFITGQKELLQIVSKALNEHSK